jgi:superfamily II DNA or RNA helicase
MLNKLQQHAYNTIISSNERITVLIGEGGSGKTFVAARIAGDFPGSVLTSATTNKAASVLRQSTGMDARTTQSAMGYRMK